jgi:multidrug resistance efflux pump
MENLEKKVNEMFKLYDEIIAERDESFNAQSLIDRELSEIYHEIEGTEFKHARQSHKMLLKLQKTLKTRRDIKGKVAVISAVTDTLNGSVKLAEKAFKTAKKKHEEILTQLVKEVEKKQKLSEELSGNCEIIELKLTKGEKNLQN